MDEFEDDQESFDTLDAELNRINDRFEKGQMRAFGHLLQTIQKRRYVTDFLLKMSQGQEQEAIMKSFAEIKRKNEQLALDLAVLRQTQLLQQEEITEETPWGDSTLGKEFEVRTVSLALDRTSLKKVSRALDDVFVSMYATNSFQYSHLLFQHFFDSN